MKRVHNHLIAQAFGHEIARGYLYHLGAKRPYFDRRFPWEKENNATQWSKDKLPSMPKSTTMVTRRWRLRRSTAKGFYEIPNYLGNEVLKKKILKKLRVNVKYSWLTQSFEADYEDDEGLLHSFIAQTFNEALFGCLVVYNKTTGNSIKV